MAKVDLVINYYLSDTICYEWINFLERYRFCFEHLAHFYSIWKDVF